MRLIHYKNVGSLESKQVVYLELVVLQGSARTVFVWEEGGALFQFEDCFPQVTVSQ